ncbi:MAG: hypothetical protein ACUVTZ_02435 [Armatimonadota bacterium]
MTLWCLLASILTAVPRSTANPNEVPNPEPPEVQVTGTPGTVQACYWVFAETDRPLPGLVSHYAGDIRNAVTGLSRPAVTPLPSDLGRGGKVTIRIKPVPGAVRYYVLKTTMLETPSAAVSVRKPGAGTLYYWVTAHNAWRRSKLAGPFPAANTDTQNPENVIQINPVPNATTYSVFVTETPEPPVGRHYWGVAEMVASTTITHRGEAAHVPAGFPATEPTEPPQALGKFLLGTTTGHPIEDVGQPLEMILPPTCNETRRSPLSVPADGVSSSRNVLGSVLGIRATGPAHAPEPSFAWTGNFAMVMDTTIDSGGINHYQSPPAGGGNYKSTIGSAMLSLTSRTQSQIANLGGYLTSYGMGDTIWLTPLVTIYGGVRDGGDEGSQVLRAHMERRTEEVQLTLAEDADRGSVQLRPQAIPGGLGAGRLIVNMSQTHSAGRIEYVDNCDAYGLNTNWTKDMVGRWISFDVDTNPQTGVRQWYQIDEVFSAEHLRFRALTVWSAHCNLGFSRFIHHPATGKGPGTYYTNKLANMTLPPDRQKAASEGRYLIAPGTQLADPFHANGRLYVEPLMERWRRGDKLVVAAGPQSFNQNIFCATFGSYMPQDVIMGIQVANFGDRTANGPGVHIGSEPGTAGWATGMLVTLPDSGMGNGIEINGEKTRYAAILVPPDIPAFRAAYQPAIPYIQMDKKTQSLDVRDNAGPVISASPEGTRLTRRVELASDAVLAGSDRMRGKARFTADGSTRRFRVRFPKPFEAEPVVMISTNQFQRCRLASVSREECVVEFESAPEAGAEVTVWWLALE